MSTNNQDMYKRHSDILQEMFGGAPTPALSAELASIRDEIRQLREALMPPKSVLITGPEVARVMAALAANKEQGNG